MNTWAGHSVLVSGASGFIGGCLARRLLQLHCRVTCLVRASSRIDELRSMGATVITSDVTDRGSIERALADSSPTAVFHLAGVVRALNTRDWTRINEGGVEAMASACAARTAPPVLVVVSSLAAAGPSTDGRLHDETHLPAPISNYGHSKLAGERGAAKYAGQTPITIVRPPIVFGPRDRAILELFKPIARWGLHIVPGRGNSQLSMIHVDDLVEGLILAAEKGERLTEHAAQGHGIYYIAATAEDSPTLAQLGQIIATSLDQKPPGIIRLPAPLMKLFGHCGNLTSMIRRRPSWINSDKVREALAGSWVCSSSKARAQLNWTPAASLADRMRETAEWYRREGWL